MNGKFGFESLQICHKLVTAWSPDKSICNFNLVYETTVHFGFIDL